MAMSSPKETLPVGDIAPEGLRVLIVAENTSTQFGGEAILPWHYFRILRARGIEAWLVTHERTRDELLSILPGEAGRMTFLPDTWLDKLCWRLSRFLNPQVYYVTLGFVNRLQTLSAARREARRLIKEKGVDIVHQPTPVSPREPSLIYGLGVPVVMGPMNGNMDYPPGLARKSRKLSLVKQFLGLSRYPTFLLHRLLPGKLQADILLAANERTKKGLPSGVRGEVALLVENGVDLDVWSPPDRPPLSEGPARFIYLGRLIDWKAVDILLDAFAQVQAPALPQLEIIGDGPMRSALEAQIDRLGLGDRVQFAGWQPQSECARRLRAADALVLPSLYECGGAVVLEAMACALPVIATDWGGPADYLDDSCGIVVTPSSREDLVRGFADAMSRLASNPSLRARLGQAGRERVVQHFSWEHKVDQMLAIYQRLTQTRGRRAALSPTHT